jgi:tripartite-type tricarboxylate transporter receptor subunit TctC
VNKLSATIAQLLRMPEVSQKLIDLGFEPIGGTPEQYGQVIASEIDKWSKVIKAANIRLD